MTKKSIKILYLNHVCWEWIFQRPQILALKLEEDFDCTVVSKKFILGKKTSHNNQEPANRKIVWQLPKGQQFKPINRINDLLYMINVRAMANRYDAIWVCHPGVFIGVPANYKGLIIYDCMDNHVELTAPDNRDRLEKLEKALIQRADIIFATSSKLKEVVPGIERAVLVRNGFSTDMATLPVKQALLKEEYTIGYFGTVSSWFDFDLLTSSLKRNSNIEYHILGPVSADVCDITEIESDNIVFDGVIEHSRLPEYTMGYDAFIMPFIINDIILSVDPVKLYEYINLGKCVISVWYPEVDRFEPYVYFYRNKDEYGDLLRELSTNGFKPKYTEEQRGEFLKQNSWDNRYDIIKEKMLEMIK